jgi:UDP-N-acetylglucosamine 2-epimerase
VRRVALAYGTRPQIIKASVLRTELARVARVTAIDTGQHYDFELNQLLYDQLGVRAPDVYLQVGSASHAEQTALVLVRSAECLMEIKPDVVVVIGDTNSTLGCALAAAKLRIPVAHVEAGLRADDVLMAEEVNRRGVDAIARLLCAPSPRTEMRLRQERPDAVIVRTGDVARDVLTQMISRLHPPPLPPGVKRGAPYVFVTLHRAELTDAPGALAQVLDAIATLPVPAVLALHPRTRAALAAHDLGTESRGALHVIPAVGYLESLALTSNARVVLTDSGGVQREAYWLGVPCVTLREETEWMETVELGANRLLSPQDGHRLVRLVSDLVDDPISPWDRGAYGDGHAGIRIAEAVDRLMGRD